MADETQRVYALVRRSEQELLDRWVDVAATSLQGQLTRSELERAWVISWRRSRQRWTWPG